MAVPQDGSDEGRSRLAEDVYANRPNREVLMSRIPRPISRPTQLKIRLWDLLDPQKALLPDWRAAIELAPPPD